MRCRMLLFVIGSGVAVCGCRADDTTRTTTKITTTTESKTETTESGGVTMTDPRVSESTRPPRERSPELDMLALDRLSRDVENANDAIQEAVALKQLQAWQRQHGTTFTVSAVSGDSGKPVTENLSTSTAMLRTTIAIFNGQQRIYTFGFVPHDNSNLALVGR